MNTVELELAPVQPGEPPMKTIAVWDSFRTKVEKLKNTADTLQITDANDRAGMALARSTRLALKEVRVAVTHRHKELKENILVEGRRIDAGKNEILALIEPLETRLIEQEQFAERELAKIQSQKREARVAELSPFLLAPVAVDLGVMEDNDYAALLIDSKSAHAARFERYSREKAEAEAKAKAEAEERERIRLENERLKKEATEREAAAKKEREASAAALAKEREEFARRERESQAKAEAAAKKLREESEERERKAKKEREAIEAELKANKAAREKIEAQLAAKKAAEAKAAAERAAAEKAAAMAPEKQKLKTFAADMRRLEVPILANPDLRKEISEAVDRMAHWIEETADAL